MAFSCEVKNTFIHFFTEADEIKNNARRSRSSPPSLHHEKPLRCIPSSRWGDLVDDDDHDRLEVKDLSYCSNHGYQDDKCEVTTTASLSSFAKSRCSDISYQSSDSEGDDAMFDGYITLMVQNFPSRAGIEDVFALLKSCFEGHFDFFYLPCKPRSGQNRGYAFVDFTSTEEAQVFLKAVQGLSIPGRESPKALKVSYSEHVNNTAKWRKADFRQPALETQWGPILCGGPQQSEPLRG